jgi:hypothetical protein
MITVYLVFASILVVSFQIATCWYLTIGARAAGKIRGGNDHDNNHLPKY